jgi:deazaflavin-dependent oxidoreductase (nitroreductase family)
VEEAVIPAIRRNAPTKFLWKVHRVVYKATSGKVGGKLTLPVLLLTMTGRKTGKPRTVALYYLTDGDNIFVIASNAGEDTHPTWWLNLRSAPEATVQIGKETFPVTAREVDGAERERLWAQAVDADRAYATYQERANRRIPVVLLDRRAKVTAPT